MVLELVFQEIMSSNLSQSQWGLLRGFNIDRHVIDSPSFRMCSELHPLGRSQSQKLQNSPILTILAHSRHFSCETLRKSPPAILR